MAAQNFLHVCIFNNFWRVVLYHRWHVPRRAAPGPKSGGAPARRSARPLLCAAPAAVNRYFLPTRRSAANLPLAAVAVNRWDRQTNRRTLDRFIDPAPHIWRRVVSLQQLSFL